MGSQERPVVLSLLALCATGCAAHAATSGPVAAPPAASTTTAGRPPPSTMGDFPSRLRKLWDFDDPAGSEARFRKLSAELRAAKDEDGALQASTQMARALGLQGKFAEAQAVLDGVQAAKVRSPAVDVRCLLEHGRLLNSSEQPIAARSYFDRALAQARTATLDALAVDAAHMMAVTFLKEPAMDIAWNREAAQIATHSADPEARRWLPVLYNNLGWAYLDSKNAREALPVLQQALELRKAEDDAEATRIAAYSVARAQRELGAFAEALETQRRLELEYAALGRPNGMVLEEIGESLLAQGNPDLAASYFARAYRELSLDPYLVEHEPKRVERLATLGHVERK